MRIDGRSFVAAGILASGVGLVCCSLFQGDVPGAANSTDSGLGDGSLTDGPNTGEGGAGNVAQVRVAYLSKNTILGPTVDICAAAGTTAAFQGPLMQSTWKGAAGVGADQVGAYVTLDAGNYELDVISVATGSEQLSLDACSTAKPNPVNYGHSVPLEAGESYTIVVLDDGQPQIYLDEAPSTSGAKIRFFNGTPQPLDYGLGGGVVFSPQVTSVAAGDINRSACSSNGYCTVPLTQAVSIDSSIRLTGSSPVNEPAASGDLRLAQGSLLSVFAVSLPPSAVSSTGAVDAGDAGQADAGSADAGSSLDYGLVVCDDTATGTEPWLSSCPLSSGDPTSLVRFANFIQGGETAGFDVCLEYAGYGTYAGPIVGGAAVAPLAVSGYESVHAGFTYSAALVPTGATSCTSPLATASIVIPPSNTTGQTVVAYGAAATPVVIDAGVSSVADAAADAADDDASTDASADAADASEDAGTEPDAGVIPGAQTVLVLPNFEGTTLPVVRGVNVAAVDPQTLSLNGSSWNIDNIAYGAFGTVGSGTGTAVDPQGFLPMSAGAASLLVVPGPGAYVWTVGTSDHDTFFLYGGGDAGVGVVQCTEVGTAGAGQSSCAPLPPQP